MKTNISALMNLISDEERNYSDLCYNLSSYATSTSVIELDGRETIIEDNKEDFDSTYKDLLESYSKLSKMKSILYEKNNSFKLSDGRSIQDAITSNTCLRKLKSEYERLLHYKNSKKRVTEVNNSYFECIRVNFDADELKNKLKEIDKEIQNTDFEIAKLNSIEFEIKL